MNSSRMHKILALVQKYQIILFLSFNEFKIYLGRGDAATQNLHYIEKSTNRCPFDTHSESTVPHKKTFFKYAHFWL